MSCRDSPGKSRPRLLFIISTRFVGGAEKSLLRVIEHLRSRFDCVLAGPITDENKEFLGEAKSYCRVVEFDTLEPKDDPGIYLPLWRFVLGCWRACLLLWRVRPNIVVFFLHLPLIAAAPRFVAALLKWRSILSFRLVANGLPVGPRRIRLLNWEKKRRQIWIAVSEENRQSLCRDMELAHDEIGLIYNGIPPSMSGSEPIRGEGRREQRRRLGLPEDRTIFLYSGRLTPLKGCRELAMASAVLWKLFPEALCVMVGDGPDRDYLDELIKIRQATPSLLLVGDRHNVSDYLVAADVVVHPSHAEGFSNSLLEALQAGRPVIATNCSSMPELVTDQVEGILVPKADSAALFHAMMRLLGDETRRLRMGKAAAIRAKAFPLSATLSAWDKLIEDVLAT